jgi:propanol-preferring alcohol dehydrogenase
MKAMLLRGRGPIETSPLVATELPDPSPGRGEIRVKVSACGICRTDLHVIEGDLPPRRTPVIPGHQVVGTVDAAGKAATRFPRGTRVGIAWLARTCGVCDFCAGGRENLCDRPLFTGYHRDGGFAEYAVVPEAFAYPLPPAFRDTEAAPLLCAGIIGYRALQRADLPAGGKLAIYGFGSSAHIVIQLALHRGCKVFVCTRGKRHRDLAKRMGASWAGEDPARMPAPADSAILFAPAGELVPPALKQLHKGGLFYEKNIRSVTANTRQDGLDLLREAAEVPIRPKVTLFPLEEANRALQLLKADKLQGTGVLTVGEG